MIDPWLGIAVILALLVGFLVVLRSVQRRLGLAPEPTRKLLHVGMAMPMLVLPWLFSALWPVALLAVAAAIVFASIRFVPELRSDVGEVLHAVRRISWGEFHYIVGMLLTFAIAGLHDQQVYIVAVAVLGFADPAAAWAGTAWRRMAGRPPLTWRDNGAKTIQGSAVFLTVAFALAFGILTVASTDMAIALPAAAVLALALMAVEASAGRGLDNLLLPVTTVVLLPWLLGLSGATLAAILLALVAATAGCWAFAGTRALRATQATARARQAR